MEPGLLESVQPELKTTLTEGAQVVETGPGSWRLQIPPGPKGRYRLAQLDDYGAQRRGDFPWRPPLRLSLRARSSAASIPGTWGFGLWNDPFGMALFTGTEALRLPALPDAAWFFFASPPNYLSLRDDLPAQGWLAATFRSPRLPALLALLMAPGALFLALPPAARLLRMVGRRAVRQAAVSVPVDPTGWHDYELLWQEDGASFGVDGQTLLETRTSPFGPLGLVIWIDNQYAAAPPGGRLSFGTLPNPDTSWVEIERLTVQRKSSPTNSRNRV